MKAKLYSAFSSGRHNVVKVCVDQRVHIFHATDDVIEVNPCDGSCQEDEVILSHEAQKLVEEFLAGGGKPLKLCPESDFSVGSQYGFTLESIACQNG